MTKKLSSSDLHLLAMACMLCDHMGRALYPGCRVLSAVGRAAFPVFAFLGAEGVFHTGNLRKYMTRLLVFALLSEVPFDLFCSGKLVDGRCANVLFTLLLGVAGIGTGNCFQRNGKPFFSLLSCLTAAALAQILGADYGAVGVAVMVSFSLFRGGGPGERAALVLFQGALWFFFFPAGQIFALLAFFPIFCYSGEQGIKSPFFRWMCYGFYPAHLLILSFWRPFYG